MKYDLSLFQVPNCDVFQGANDCTFVEFVVDHVRSGDCPEDAVLDVSKERLHHHAHTHAKKSFFYKNIISQTVFSFYFLELGLLQFVMIVFMWIGKNIVVKSEMNTFYSLCENKVKTIG